MASTPTIKRGGRADWALITAIHDALRRDLDELLHTRANRMAAQARWAVFRDQLRFHLAAEETAVWPLARAKLTLNCHAQGLLDAMDDEHKLIGPLLAATDDAFTRDADPVRLRQLLARLGTKLTSHLAHEEADALPLIGQIMSQRELSKIAAAIRGGHRPRHTPRTVPWALAHVSPSARTQVLSQLPAPARFLYRRVWLPRYTRITLPLLTTPRLLPPGVAAGDQPRERP